MRKGDNSRDLYVIKNGSVRVVAGSDEEEETICELGP